MLTLLETVELFQTCSGSSHKESIVLTVVIVYLSVNLQYRRGIQIK